MKYLKQLNKILTINQKKTAIYLTLLSFISMMLEILTLNFMLILLSYMTNPLTLSNSKFFAYLQNINFNYDLNLIIIIIFISSFFIKTFFNIFYHNKQVKFVHVSRSELSHSFFKGYLYFS